MGISTRIFTTENFPVPSTWIFEKFLNLPEKLEGQNVSMLSIFNKKDSNPSMIIYVADNDRYKFNCFSSGRKGDAIDLIQHLYNLPTRQEAFKKAYDFWMSGDYESYDTRVILKSTFEITQYKTRGWNTNDAAYWLQFHIGSDDLKEHYVQPLEEYTTVKTTGDQKVERTFSREYCYGFFRKNGSLYKIYNPYIKKAKFIKVQNYIQGHDQLKFEAGWLVILASLKDMMSFKRLGFPNVECIAPDSENTLLTQEQLDYYLQKYKFVSVLFDGDTAGKKSALKYHEDYGLPFTTFEVENDIAECVKQHGIKNTRLFLQPKLLKTKREYYKPIRKTP
jgi:hypothetical protein